MFTVTVKVTAKVFSLVLTQNRMSRGAACCLVVHKVLNHNKGLSSSNRVTPGNQGKLDSSLKGK